MNKIYLIVLSLGIMTVMHAAEQVIVNNNGTTINDAVVITDTTDSGTKDSGALVVDGGLGVESNLNVGGAVSASSIKLANGSAVTEISSDTSMANNSDSSIPTQRAVKSYVDSSSAGFTTGDIKQTLAVTEPAGWLFLNGQEVSRTGDTAGLFALFGTSFGAGDGNSTFNLPDARGRMLSTLDNMGGVSANVVQNSAADNIGGTTGAETHTLTISEMPSHNHGGSTSTAGAHTHTLPYGSSTGGWGKSSANGVSTPAYSIHSTVNSASTHSSGNHSHVISSQGGGQAHNNMPPTLFVQTLIKK